MNEYYDYVKDLTDEKKKSMGIVYTPMNIVNWINEKVLSHWKEQRPPRVVDFSCGTGVFLKDMADKISERYGLSLSEVYSKYIFGSDIDEDALQICRKNTGCPNITYLDGLDFDPSQYDIIVGNPPYVRLRNLDEDTQKKVKSFPWCKVGNTDLYIAMSEIICKSGKIFGFISPNSWIKSSTGKPMAEWFLEKQIVTDFIDFRGKKVFDVGAYCSILISDSQSHSQYNFSTDIGAEHEQKKYAEQDSSTFYLSESEISFVNSILEKPVRLLDVCDLKVGIATLCDGIYFMKDCVVEDDLVIFGGTQIEKGATKLCYKASKLDRYDKATEDRIIYPYDDKTKPFDEEWFKCTYPMAYDYLSQHKDKLLSRDKNKFGKKVKEGKATWYEYGRLQGLSLKDEKILVCPIMTKKTFMKIDSGLFLSGYCLIAKNNIDIDEILTAVQSESFREWAKLFGSPKQGGYFSINKATIEKYRY